MSGRSQVSSRSNTSHVTDTLTTVARMLDVPPDRVDLLQVTRDLLVRAVLDYRTRPDRWFTRPTHQASRTRSDESVRRRISAVRTFFAWCVRTGRLPTDPTVGIDAPPSEPPTAEGADRSGSTPAAGGRGHLVMARTRRPAGLARDRSRVRLSETAESRADRLLGDPLTHLRVTGKGDKTRDVPLMPPVVAAPAT